MSQEVPEVRFWGKAYQYRVLPFGLALSPRTFTKCVDAALVLLRLQRIRIMNYIDNWLILAQSHQLAVRHRDVVLAHMKKLGLRLKRTTFLGVIWDSTSMQARLSPARIESILSAVERIRLGQSLTVRQFQSQRLLSLMATASNVITFGLLHMRPLQWWLRTTGFSPRGDPFRMIKVTRQFLRTLVNVEETLVPVPGSHVGSFMSSQDANDRCLPHGLGSDLRGSQGLWKKHHLSWHINCLEMLAVFLALKNFLAYLRGHHVLVRSDNTSVVSYINHKGGLRSRPLSKLACQILMWSQGKLLSP